MLNSRSLPAFPFNADLTDCVLMALPDFQSLQGFISSSKFAYSIFRARPNSILGAVARSQFGSTFPQAMNLVRCLSSPHSSKSALDHGLYCEGLGFAQEFSVTSAQARLLRDHSSVVQALEDIYSWREKDPRSRSSQLSVTESLEFRQSLYRFWLFSARYGLGALGNGEYHTQFRESVVAEQTVFLSNLGDLEQLGVLEVHQFLLDLAKWALIKNNSRPARPRVGSDIDDICLVWGGPAVTLDAFRGKCPSFLHPSDSQWYGTWRAATHAFLITQQALTTGGRASLTMQRSVILDGRFMDTINCSQCQGSHLPSRINLLWSLCNWESMVLVIPPSRLSSFLTFERRKPLEFLLSFIEAIQSIPYSQLIEEIFDIRSERFRHWKKDDWLCTYCMTRLLSGNIQTWFDGRASMY